MRRIFFIGFSLYLLVFTSCKNDNQDTLSTDLVNNPNTATGEVSTENLPVIKFAEEAFDFGKITQGEKVHHAFKFTNTGKSNLIISSASASCGCTVPQYPKEPIKPGESSFIDVVFNSDGKEGQITKQVTVVANTQPGTNLVTIRGEVIVPSK